MYLIDLQHDYFERNNTHENNVKWNTLYKGVSKCVKLFIKLHQTSEFDDLFDTFELPIKLIFFGKIKKEEKISVWWGLMASKLFIKLNWLIKPNFLVWWQFFAFESNYIKLIAKKHRAECKTQTLEGFWNVLVVRFLSFECFY